MNLTLNLKLFFIFLSMGLSCWALDQYDRKSFNIDSLRYSYQADADCEIASVQGKHLSFEFDPEGQQIRTLFDNISLPGFSSIDHINAGKKSFASCLRDRKKGYFENEAFNSRIVKRTLVQRGGKFCVGSEQISSEELYFDFYQNKVLMRLVFADYESGQVSDSICRFTRQSNLQND